MFCKKTNPKKGLSDEADQEKRPYRSAAERLGPFGQKQVDGQQTAPNASRTDPWPAQKQLEAKTLIKKRRKSIEELWKSGT